MEEQQTTPVALKEMEVQELVSRMRGTLLRPGDEGYEQVNASYDQAAKGKLPERRRLRKRRQNPASGRAQARCRRGATRRPFAGCERSLRRP